MTWYIKLEEAKSFYCEECGERCKPRVVRSNRHSIKTGEILYYVKGSCPLYKDTFWGDNGHASFSVGDDGYLPELSPVNYVMTYAEIAAVLGDDFEMENHE